jgi:hypothetical protein
LRQELADARNAEDAARLLEEHTAALERQTAAPAAQNPG